MEINACECCGRAFGGKTRWTVRWPSGAVYAIICKTCKDRKPYGADMTYTQVK